jgi:DNA-binding transcriptional MerR regulator
MTPIQANLNSLMVPKTEQGPSSKRRLGKSPSAFRTISEVAKELAVPQHVLRFWESKFPQVNPMKRRGGHRYYRPEDLAFLHKIRDLLYNDGYTIKGAQKNLKENFTKIAKNDPQLAQHSADLSGNKKLDLQSIMAELVDIQNSLLNGLSD